VAVIASTAALWMAQALRAQHARHASALRIGAALVMGIAITGMHYMAMAAAHFAPDARCGAANRIDAPWLATTIAMFTTATLTVTLLVCRFDARTTFLRGMTDTLERLVRVRTAELETALRRYEQTTAMLQRTRENMATEIDERRAAQARSSRRRTNSGAAARARGPPYSAAIGKARVDRPARGRRRARDQQSDRLHQREPQHAAHVGAQPARRARRARRAAAAPSRPRATRWRRSAARPTSTTCATRSSR
jgi:hypothetical protein